MIPVTCYWSKCQMVVSWVITFTGVVMYYLKLTYSSHAAISFMLSLFYITSITEFWPVITVLMLGYHGFQTYYMYNEASEYQATLYFSALSLIIFTFMPYLSELYRK